MKNDRQFTVDWCSEMKFLTIKERMIVLLILIILKDREMTTWQRWVKESVTGRWDAKIMGERKTNSFDQKMVRVSILSLSFPLFPSLSSLKCPSRKEMMWSSITCVTSAVAGGVWWSGRWWWWGDKREECNGKVMLLLKETIVGNEKRLSLFPSFSLISF